MKDRFLWFCGGYAVGLLMAAALVARGIERAIVGEGDEYVRKVREEADSKRLPPLHHVDG